MAYLVRITEWKTGGREFLIFYNEQPAILSESISRAEPISLRTLAGNSCHMGNGHVADQELCVSPCARYRFILAHYVCEYLVFTAHLFGGQIRDA
jgi:hypothetical protein